jgi:hypothetical protein
MPTLFPNFLTDDSEYAHAQGEWARIWEAIPAHDRASFGWRAGWFKLAPPNDGNPIFTAISDAQQKAIRVIQYEPTMDSMEFDFWIDNYGGNVIEPTSIRELVIACALSTESAQRAFDLMSSWVVGDIEITRAEPIRGITRIRAARKSWQESISAPDAEQIQNEGV